MQTHRPFHRIILLLVTVILLLTATDIGRSARANSTPVTFAKHVVDSGFSRPEYGHAIDVDNDQDVDILAISDYGSIVAWWENNGDQGFSRHNISADFNRGATSYGADIDGDGDIDVVGTEYIPGQIAWWENDGSQVFTKHVIAQMPSRGRCAYPVDLDQDGDQDILAASYYGVIIWLENDGTGVFITHTLADDLGYSYWARTADLDGDGDVDVLATGCGGAGFIWFENDGYQNFAMHAVGSGAQVRTVFPVDLDGDADVDVLTADLGFDELVWYENDGAQAFTKHIVTTFGRTEDLSEAFPADLDNDGDLDVIGAVTGAGFVAWWENDGTQTFTQHMIDGAMSGTLFAEAQDIDQDGDLDIVATAYNYGHVVWYENLSDIPPNRAPLITELNLDQPIVDENGTVNLAGSFADPDTKDIHTIVIDWGNGHSVTLTLAVGSRTFSAAHPYVDDDPSGSPADDYTITVTVTDDGMQSDTGSVVVTVNNLAPVAAITAPDAFSLFAVGELVTFEGSFTDAGLLDTHTAKWTFDAATIDAPIALLGSVAQGSGNGTASLETRFSMAGVYRVTLTITDDDGGVGTATTTIDDLEATVIIYDPDGGFVTGGGWIDSPEGACQLDWCDDDTTGKANFGFVSKYKKGADVPTGQTEFQLKAGDLNFHSSSYDWLVVTGSNYARFKGLGTINGEGDYKLMLWAGDGTGSSGEDTFRIKIWWEEGEAEHVVYDNGMYQAIGGGSIVVHAK
jgi:hypothetical protein